MKIFKIRVAPSGCSLMYSCSELRHFIIAFFQGEYYNNVQPQDNYYYNIHLEKRKKNYECNITNDYFGQCANIIQ